MANGQPLVVDPYTIASGGTQAVYRLNNSTSAITQIGSTLPAGMTPGSLSEQRGSWSANAAVQIGDFIYAWVNGIIYRYDLNNPTTDWVLYHTVIGSSTRNHGGLFSAVIDGEDYLIGVGAIVGFGGQGFKINLATDELTVAAENSTIEHGSPSFRDCIQFHGRLFFRNSLGTHNVAYYEPRTNTNGRCAFPSSSTNDTVSSSFTGRQTLITYNNELYSIGKNSNVGANGVSIWRLHEPTMSFEFINTFGITTANTSSTSVKEISFVNPSTTHVRETLTSGVSQSIFYLSYGPDPVTEGWRLYEIYPDSATTFAAFKWDEAFSSPLTDVESGWGIAPFPDERHADGDTTYMLYYTSDKSISATPTIGVYEFLPEVDDLVLDHPALSALGLGGDWGYMCLPQSVDGGGEKLFNDGSETANIRINRLELISSTTWRITFTLWHASVTDFSVAFTFSTDQEVPKTFCTLSNSSHGTIGGSPSHIDGLSANDGGTEYTVEWNAVDDGIVEFDWIRVVGWVYTAPLGSSPPDNFSPAYDIRHIDYYTAVADSVSSTVDFKVFQESYSEFTTAISSAVEFKQFHVEPTITDSLSESIQFEIPDPVESTANFTGAATPEIIIGAERPESDVTFSGTATPTIQDPYINTAIFTGTASATKEANPTVSNTVTFTGTGTEASTLIRSTSNTVNLIGTATPNRVWTRSTDNDVSFTESITANPLHTADNTAQFSGVASSHTTPALNSAHIVVYGSSNYQATNSGSPQGGAIALTTKIITTPVQFGRLELRSSSALDRNQRYLVEGYLKGGYPTSDIVMLNGSNAVQTSKVMAVMRISKLSGGSLDGQVIAQVNSQTIGILDKDPHGAVEALELRRLFYQTYGDRDSSTVFYEKVFIRNNHPELTLTHVNISQALDEDETVEFAFDSTVNGNSTSTSRINRPQDILSAQFTDIPRNIPNIAPAEAIGMWLRIVVPQGQTSAVVV
jgi:hypothetical protein